jgi:hydroxymethylpyrimidine/phosphomethylpyrimidine kinase
LPLTVPEGTTHTHAAESLGLLRSYNAAALLIESTARKETLSAAVSMRQDSASIPIVLSIAGHDPCGGAGIQADIETIFSLGCRAATVVTALTVQDTCDVQRVIPVEPGLVVEQARAVLEDLAVAAIKLGFLASADIVQSVHSVLQDYPSIPVVLDPVLASGAGTSMASGEIDQALSTLLMPLATVMTPNSVEAKRLAPEGDNLNACAMALLERGCGFVLITGGHEPGPEVINRLYANHRLLESYRWRRLAESFHGSGCTLAAAIAAQLAQGDEPPSAVHRAQSYTWSALAHGLRPGMGQLLPDRGFWTNGNGDE